MNNQGNQSLINAVPLGQGSYFPSSSGVALAYFLDLSLSQFRVGMPRSSWKIFRVQSGRMIVASSKALWVKARAVPIASGQSFRVSARAIAITPRQKFRPLTRVMVITLLFAALLLHVFRIIRIRPQEKVSGITARRVVASVADEKMAGINPVVQEVGDAVGSIDALLLIPCEAYLSVPSGTSGFMPKPAFIRPGLSNLLVETCDFLLSELRQFTMQASHSFLLFRKLWSGLKGRWRVPSARLYFTSVTGWPEAICLRAGL
jgi:hypothetical protein